MNAGNINAVLFMASTDQVYGFSKTEKWYTPEEQNKEQKSQVQIFVTFLRNDIDLQIDLHDSLLW